MSGIISAWREVRGIVLSLAGFSLLAWLARQRFLALVSTVLLGWVFYFFRDPAREPDSPVAALILAPADGKVTDIELIHEPLFFEGPARRVSVFLSIFDAHVQRAPFQGEVKFLCYRPGSFMPAFFRDTRDNESNMIGLVTPHGRLAVKQIAGILARRIICRVGLGDYVIRGERLGLIKFGSRVDLLLPPEVEVLVEVGQQTYAGQTVVGQWR